jgi:cyanophycinase-like exopeptidase
MKQLLTAITATFLTLQLSAQDYTSYFTGNPQDLAVSAFGGVCLMGGATEHDEAMKWFLQRAYGGDILVLRASGADGYNDYMYSDLGVQVNSVETIVCNNANASYDPYVISKIAQAEAIWFAGGDQWNYISYWRNTPVDSAINAGILNRGIAIGGTSAGMAIQGEYYFSAQNGTVTSATALSNPYSNTVTIDNAPFINNNQLVNTITDTHFDNPDRSGRLMTFMARMRTDDGVVPKAIACNEYVAVCIDPSGIATVYGDYPNYEEYAYFLQLNCEIANNTPETCSPGNPLTWDQNASAVKVYKVPGTMNGTNYFSLADWSTGSGGEWQNWSVANGVLSQTTSSAIDCGLGLSANSMEISLSPVPVSNELVISSSLKMDFLEVLSIDGKLILNENKGLLTMKTINVCALSSGVYLLRIYSNGTVHEERFVKE